MAPAPSRYVPLLVLLAVIPAALYITGRADPVVVLSLVSVAIIAGSLYRLFGGGESEPTGH
ncbi:MAG: hypothetical protein ABEJ70_03210 [Halobacteriaceae archaeon]